jgi:hypothetical protein
MPATITGFKFKLVFKLAEGLVAAVLSDTLQVTLTAPRSTAAELRFFSTRSPYLNLRSAMKIALQKPSFC